MSMAAAHTIGYVAAFVAGVAGSVHCFAMCGGLAGAMGMRARHSGISPQKSFAHAATTQLGRILSYTLAGVLCGAFGGMFARTLALSPLVLAMRVAAGLLLIALALKVLFQWNLLRSLERAGAHFWRRIAPLAQLIGTQRIGSDSFKQSLLLGALWGWLPCGLVYSMLLFATFSGNSLQGAGIMLAFGMGTLPAMLTNSLLASQIARIVLGRNVRLGAGVLLLLFGLWTVAAPLRHEVHESHATHSGHVM